MPGHARTLDPQQELSTQTWPGNENMENTWKITHPQRRTSSPNEWMKNLWKIPGKTCWANTHTYACMWKASGCGRGFGHGYGYGHIGWPAGGSKINGLKILKRSIFMFSSLPKSPTPLPHTLSIAVCAPISIPILILIPLEIAVCALAAAFSICKLALNESMDFASFLVQIAVVSEGGSSSW